MTENWRTEMSNDRYDVSYSMLASMTFKGIMEDSKLTSYLAKKRLVGLIEEIFSSELGFFIGWHCFDKTVKFNNKSTFSRYARRDEIPESFCFHLHVGKNYEHWQMHIISIEDFIAFFLDKEFNIDWDGNAYVGSFSGQISGREILDEFFDNWKDWDVVKKAEESRKEFDDLAKIDNHGEGSQP